MCTKEYEGMTDTEFVEEVKKIRDSSGSVEEIRARLHEKFNYSKVIIFLNPKCLKDIKQFTILLDGPFTNAIYIDPN